MLDNNEPYVIIINTKEEQDKLHDLCVNNNVPIPYPSLFSNEKLHHIWGMNKNGIAALGNVVARHVSKNHILHSLEDVEELMKEMFNN